MAFFDHSLFLYAFVAAFLGWLIAKFPPSSLYQHFKHRAWKRSYLQGLHLLLNEKSDQSIEEMVSAWPVNAENFELHNALGNMLRRKGEVDRAIAIHNNLLHSTKHHKVGKKQLRLASFELAQDYIKSGLLDRAERLLINIVNNSKDFEEESLTLLLGLYELEKDWEKAIVIAKQLVERSQLKGAPNKLSSQISHYFCEIAQVCFDKDDYKGVELALLQAKQADRASVRAYMLSVQLCNRLKQYEQARQVLDEIEQLDRLLLVECVDLLRQAEPDVKLRLDIMLRWQSHFPSVTLESAIYTDWSNVNAGEAHRFFLDAVQARPTLKGLSLFMTEYIKAKPEDATNESISLLYSLVQEVMKNKASYQCGSCGFSGNQLHWQCPQCHQWDSIRLLRGAEGD